jgi:hypothetical protein
VLVSSRGEDKYESEKREGMGLSGVNGSFGGHVETRE